MPGAFPVWISQVGKRRGTGQYETFIANGRALAYNEPHSRIVRADLERTAAEIAG